VAERGVAEHSAAADVRFPRQSARTQRFSLGAPRSFTVCPDGERVLFLRSRGPEDPLTCLWSLEVGTGTETLLADPATLTTSDDPEAERARRERARELAGGIVGYAADRACRQVGFALGGRAWLLDVQQAGAGARQLATPPDVVDPRPDPTGARLAYAAGRALRVVEASGSGDRVVAASHDEQVSWGLAEFVAAEEMGRLRGYWWAPDGERLLAARADETAVRRAWIADPTHPEQPPAQRAYPYAGTPNADVRLFVCGLAGERTEVDWDRTTFEYVVTADWSKRGLLLVVQDRHQQRLRLLDVDPDTGATSLLREDSDPAWVDIVAGVPAWCGERLIWAADAGDARRLVVDGEPVTPPALQLREVCHADDHGVLFTASVEPTEAHVWRWSPDGSLVQVTTGAGVHAAAGGAGTAVVTSRMLDRLGAESRVLRDGEPAVTIRSYAATPTLAPRPILLTAGDRRLAAALLYPTGHKPGSRRLPVLLDPYGGPHAQRVTARCSAYAESQWLADQGFAVLVVDGRGSPGRGSAFERTVRGDLATPVLDDQVDALRAIAAERPDLDVDRVGIRGWSYGGFLAALAVLRRPDVFHAAVAGAPVTDWTLYDTHYTERYLGTDPYDTDAGAYQASSLIAEAGSLTRPLLLLHGLADDNVVVAHTLRLSAALLASRRPHCVLPLSGATHMASQEDVAENRLLLEVDFLRRSLGIDPAYSAPGGR
jgi:dipeptidyl-peptidase-4